VPAVDVKAIPDLPMLDLPFSDTPDAAVCDQLASFARAQVDSYLQSSFSLACQIDSDCSLLGIQSLNCAAPCGGPLLRTADISAVTAATAGVCNQYFGAGCPAKYPPCPDIHAVCDYGTCATAIGRGGLSGSADAAFDVGTGEVASDGGNASVAKDSALEDASTIVDGGSCIWPASLNPQDASDGQCIAARTFLTCTNANCISDDLIRCSNPLVTSSGTCQNRCSSTEYGLQCGKVGPSTFDVPDGCRGITALPAGIGFYCCPCGG
jgi:hypothetical protein